ncbi:MAG: hypothetical protein HZC43_02385 [Nitrosomonadales bacterium]|nr:hypothetical protein [Nitrosomonadales bacterium]
MKLAMPVSLTRAWLLPLQRLYNHGLPLAGATLSRWRERGRTNRCASFTLKRRLDKKSAFTAPARNGGCAALIQLHFFSENKFRALLKIHISSQLLRCGKNFLLTYHTYAALRNFFHALHLGEL